METQIKKYRKLNEIALKGGVVIFGEGTDTEIPASELKHSFELEDPVYNRSFLALSLDDAIALYDECVAPLAPDTVLLHIGANEEDLFEQNQTAFEQKYIALIEHIKTLNKKCRIVVVSVEGSTLNPSLKYIADSTKCEFGDLSGSKVWNPQTTKNVTSFIQSMGVRRYCKTKPVYDLLKIFFCY